MERDINSNIVIHAHPEQPPQIQIIFRRPDRDHNEYEVITHDEADVLIEALKEAKRRFPAVDANTKRLQDLLRELRSSESALARASLAANDRQAVLKAIKEVQDAIESVEDELSKIP